MAPSATFCHKPVALAVGLAANSRKAAGLTPRTATSPPLTLSLAASSASAAVTPGSRLIAARALPGSILAATTNRSAGCRARSRPTRGPAARPARPVRFATGTAAPPVVPAAGPVRPGPAGRGCLAAG